MSLESKDRPSEAERAELERVVEALAKWPRLSQLLRYMGEKYFSGNSSELNEYNIATEVLGRSKSVFNSAEDAIARVETHRLRKRLAEFYEKEGRDHEIQVTLPSGTYVPVFVRNPLSDHSPIASPSEQESELKHPDGSPDISRSAFRPRNLIFAVSVIAAIASIYLFRRNEAPVTHLASLSSAPSAATSAASNTAKSSSTIRLLAGYSGPPRTDSAGQVWNQDTYFSGGGAWQPPSQFISRTSDPFLFEHARTGDFSYNIPLKPGTYEAHFYFSTQSRSTESTTFNVAINGRPVLDSFDINSDAFGENVADEKILRDISPQADGFLHIVFTGGSGSPYLNAIEILPGIPHAQLPVRIVMQPNPITDREGRLWHPDTYYIGGRISLQVHPLPNSAEPDLFAGERYGHFNYAIPVDSRDRYTVVLHFVEFYFGSGATGNGGTGSRTFNVFCNGQTLLEDFDVYKEVGNLHELVKTFRHLKPSPQGKLNLTFEPIANNATVSGIEVLDESQ